MNDEFLYRLRVQPPPTFAARLKARLEIEAAIAAAKRRTLKLVAFCGIFLGAAATALVVPTVRSGIASWLEQGHEIQAPAVEPKVVAAIRAGAAIPHETPAQAPAPQAATAVVAPNGVGAAGPSAAPSPRSQIKIDVLSIQVPPALIDGVFESYRKAYGYQVRNRDLAEDESVCTRWVAPDAVVTLGRMSDANRTECSQMGARFIEVPLAYEAYVAVVHRDNTWAEAMTLEELRAAAERMPFDPLTTWNQLRSTWPSLPITLFGVDSTERSSSGRFAPSREARSLPIRIKRDDAGIPRAVEATYGGLGFMSFATYMSQKRAAEKVGSGVPVKVLAIVNAEGTAALPSQQTIQDGRYDTLSRPLLLYLNIDRLAYSWVSLFGTHTVDVASQRAGESGFTALDKYNVDMAVRKIRAAREAR